MDVKFYKLLQSFMPKGRAWENNSELQKLLDGFSYEFGRVHKDIKSFYENFNIINSTDLAVEHSKDYLIVQGLYTNSELQRIIVEYLNKDFSIKEVIEDFANFSNIPIEYTLLPKPFIFGSSKFGDEFGYKNSTIMQIYIKFIGSPTCKEYNKIRWLAEFLKPPYLKVEYSSVPTIANDSFTFGKSRFGEKFVNIIPCEIIN